MLYCSFLKWTPVYLFDLWFCCCYVCNLALFSAQLPVGHFIGEDPVRLLSFGVLLILAADILSGKWLSHSAYLAFSPSAYSLRVFR